MGRMQPVFKPLLKPHLEDIECKVAPGLLMLTWSSMNIDAYLLRLKQVCCSAVLVGTNHDWCHRLAAWGWGGLQALTMACMPSVGPVTARGARAQAG
jgi:Dynein heavy chain, N-terminal region 1